MVMLLRTFHLQTKFVRKQLTRHTYCETVKTNIEMTNVTRSELLVGLSSAIFTIPN